MDSPLIISEHHDSVAIIRLNRPEERNALSREMIEALADIFTSVKQQSDLRAIILTGNGDSFCGGADIGELTELDTDQVHEVAERGQTLCKQIESCGVPVIAAVRGIAAGGGCELALSCHLRVAAIDAQFSLPEAKLGVTGRTIPASEAFEVGLVNSVVPVAELLKEAQALGQEIAQLAPLAISACLRAVTQGTRLPLDEGLALEAKLFAHLFATEDVREGTAAFLEKRAPLFKGK